MPQQRTTVFVSYSKRDRYWLERLQVHLAPHVRAGTLDLWDDTKLNAGDLWRSAISDAIDRAAASIVLISADFLASDFAATEELPKLLQKAERHGAKILPIFVAPCELASHSRLASFQAINPPDRPLSLMTKTRAERVLQSVVTTIEPLLRPQPSLPPTDDTLLDELHSATIALSILWTLAKGGAGCDYTLSELEQLLGIRSRKRANEMVTRLCSADWVEKRKASGLTKWRLSENGVRQLRRLVAASDGPLRRSISSDWLNGSTPLPRTSGDRR